MRDFLTNREAVAPPGIDHAVWVSAIPNVRQLRVCHDCIEGSHGRCEDINNDFMFDDGDVPMIFCDCYKDTPDLHRSYRMHVDMLENPWGVDEIFNDILRECAAEVYNALPPAKPTVDDLADRVVEGLAQRYAGWAARSACEQLVELLREHGYLEPEDLEEEEDL
jgi:hypothetical protein